MVLSMAGLDKNDLAQMNEDYFKSLKNERLVEVAKNLHQLAMELWEKQQQNSENSSLPPSKDNPYTSNSTKEESSQNPETELTQEKTKDNQGFDSQQEDRNQNSPRKAGKQPGAQGFWRKQPLKAEMIVPHYPDQCAACNHSLKD